MKKQITMLVTGIGGPTPRSIAKTIRRLNINYKIIGIDADPKALGFFIPGLVDKHYLSPRATDYAYWPFINNLIKEENIDIAFVQPELEVIEWGNYLNVYGVLPCKVFIPPVELASVLMDKSKMAETLEGTAFIPKTLKINQIDQKISETETYIKFPCWIRAIKGSGGLGSLKVENIDVFKSWMYINRDICDFTVSEFLPGRHLATQMLYIDGDYFKGASLECVEYIMASIAPSKVTGNTSFGRFINEERILTFCNDCVKYICDKLKIKAHGVLSFDLKEDASGNLKVTEVNIRHMAYTGVMANAGFNLIKDTITLLQDNSTERIEKQTFFKFDKPYVFLRDVDSEPVLLESEKWVTKSDEI